MWNSERDLQLWEEIAQEAHSRHSRKSGLYVGLLTDVERHAHQLIADKARGSKRVLEIGIGGGEHLVFRHSDTGTERYVGLDLSPVYAEICERKFGVKVVVADAGRMPFEDAAFDCVIAVAILEHVENLATVLAEIERVLEPGGRFLAAIPTNGSLAVGAFKAVMTYPTMRRRGIRRPDLVWHHLNVNCFKRVRSLLLQRFPATAQVAVPFRWLPWRLSPLWALLATKK
ncbi:MAG: class I SAM-dependent methyltransferase [Rhizobiaceae bacterium]|nr:class I SAM-dependent methyltransferase [Rhizobiaceae bacterium]